MDQQIEREGLVNIIKYDEDNAALVWKHPAEDFRMGTQLIVHESQEAVFCRDGRALDVFGAGRYTLETQRLPLLDQFFRLPSDTERTFHSEVYFINMATQMGIKWGTDSKIRFLEPYSGLPMEIGACGEFHIRVCNSRKLLLKVVGTSSGFGQDNLLGADEEKGYFRSLVMTQVKSSLAQIIKQEKINILEIDAELLRLSGILKTGLNGMFEEYGLTMPDFYISRVITPDEDPNYRRLKEQYAQQYLLVRQEEIRRKEAEAAAERKAVEAQTEARLKIIEAQGSAEILKLQKSAEAEGYKMQAAAQAAEMQMKGYTYQQETSRLVGLEAMKNGLGGGEGGASMLGNLTGLGIGLGAMGGVANLTKDALSPLMEQGAQMGQSVNEMVKPAWNCSCGQNGNIGKFLQQLRQEEERVEDMRKKLIRGYILIAFVLIIYITAVTPFPKTAVFGIALGFSLPAFLAQIYTLHAVMKNQALIKDRLYDFPVIRVSVLYLAAQLCASLLLMGFADKLPVFAAVIIEMVILAAAVMGLYAIGSARTEAVRQDVQLKREMTKMKEMQAQVNLLISQCREGQVRDMLGKLSEEIRYSSPLSGEASEEIEEEIAVLLTEIEAAALDEDVENVAQLYDRMTGLLRERDRICKDSKWQQF